MNKKLSAAIKRGQARRRAEEAKKAQREEVVIIRQGDRRTGEEINHPAHYQAVGMEVADVCEAFNCDWHTGTAIKYLLRAGKKDAEISDIKKALWYIARRANKKLNNALLIDEKGNVTHLVIDRG